MQQDVTPSNDEQTTEPDWILASYGQRVGAWALDFVASILIKFLLIIVALALLLRVAFSGFGSVFDIPDWSFTIMVIATVVIGIGIGYIVWWLFALGRGQTPGKQIVGIRVIKDDGSPSGWGYTFLREFVIKFLLVGTLAGATSGMFWLVWLVDNLWPLWDRAGKMQTLHDKLLGTLVVRDPR